ncbi:MAG: hypothetical protein KDC85_18275 [Saprospiraceae bacterium]|nr:hypothetical protein [Saprospiraceae bacterium]MCB9325882.1 hypothetical protein [Lewinellaceae bacterium]
MQITAKDTADFYNSLFFDEEKNLVEPHVSLFIKSGENQLVIPDIKITAKKEFHQIILDFHNRLLKNGPLVLEEAAEPPKSETPLIDFKRVEYRDNAYFVEQLDLETFRILNEERTKEISLKSPTAKAIIKRFKEAF